MVFGHSFYRKKKTKSQDFSAYNFTSAKMGKITVGMRCKDKYSQRAL